MLRSRLPKASLLAFALAAAVPARAEHPKVAAARRAKAEELAALFARAGASYPPSAIYLRAFKLEGELELWAKRDKGEDYALVKRYRICAGSGDPGPKRAEGDGQVPEGFYRVSVWNPVSRFHLWLGLDYPNASDRIRGKRPLGGAIMIHGNCVTIGCIPITDDGIDEVYLAALDARAKPVPVHVFPARLDADGWARLESYARRRPELRGFWKELEAGYARFEDTHKLFGVRVGRNGRYEVGP